jgi:tRNA(Ile)-lysidine synthase
MAEALLRTGRIAGDDIDFLDKQVTRLWDNITHQQEKAIVLDREGFDPLPSSLKRYLLRASVEKLLGSAKDVETRHIEEMMSMVTKPAGKRLNLPQGLIFSIEYNQYRLTSDSVSSSPFPTLEDEVPLNIPGQTSLPGWRIEATIIDRERMTEKDDFTAYLDLAKTGDKLTVRPRRRGDRFQPLGLPQAKKVGEFMIDAKIPQAWRGKIPIVCSPEQIVWVVGWRIDERVKVNEDTKKVLRLEFKRLD